MFTVCFALACDAVNVDRSTQGQRRTWLCSCSVCRFRSTRGHVRKRSGTWDSQAGRLNMFPVLGDTIACLQGIHSPGYTCCFLHQQRECCFHSRAQLCRCQKRCCWPHIEVKVAAMQQAARANWSLGHVACRPAVSGYLQC